LARSIAGSRRSQVVSSEVPPGTLTFPKGFLWGTATAAHQIERASPNDWTALEEAAVAARRFSRTAPGKAIGGHIHKYGDWSEDIRTLKTNHDALFREDMKMASGMGHSAYRFSIEWSRLFPTADQQEPAEEALEHYNAIIHEVLLHGMVPSVTLFHFTSPLWLWTSPHGPRGFERADTLEHWERFVRAVVRAFGDRVSHWCTLNEPMVYAYAGYLDGVFPPLEQRGDPGRIGPLLVQLLQAHALAYRIIHDDARARGKAVMVGLTQHTRAFEPHRNHVPLDRVVASVVDQTFVWDLLDAVTTGEFRMTGAGFRASVPEAKGTQDYVGINYYGRFYVRSNVLHPTRFEILMHDPNGGDPVVNNLGWAEYPRGFSQVLTAASERYALPIYVLENGTADGADDDVMRQRYLVRHVREMWHAINLGGADVRGYFHWSLMDNFEWAEGFDARFGLVKVDYRNGFRRIPRPSAAIYSRIARENALSSDLM